MQAQKKACTKAAIYAPESRWRCAHAGAGLFTLLLVLAGAPGTRAQEQAHAPGSYWDASASACSECPKCTCAAGTGLGSGGYDGGCSACAPGSYAPDAAPAFEFVGEGTCTGTCAHTKVLSSESACALECLKWPGCVGICKSNTPRPLCLPARTCAQTRRLYHSTSTCVCGARTLPWAFAVGIKATPHKQHSSRSRAYRLHNGREQPSACTRRFYVKQRATRKIQQRSAHGQLACAAACVCTARPEPSCA